MFQWIQRLTCKHLSIREELRPPKSRLYGDMNYVVGVCRACGQVRWMKEAYEDGSHSAINWDTEINRCITTRIMRKGGKMEGNKFKVGDLVKHRSGWFGCVMDVELIQSIRLRPVPVARLTVSPLPNQGFSWCSCVSYEGEFTRVEGTVKKPDEPRFKPGDRVWFAGTVVKWFSPVNGHSCAEVNLDGGADGHPTLITERGVWARTDRTAQEKRAAMDR